MKCIECGSAMTESLESHDYGSCGLPVRLHGVIIRRCPSCGEEEVAIPRMEELHRLIARAVIHKPSGLSGAEVRFLRKWLGHSGRDLAAIMGVTPETVSRWETGAIPLGTTADRLLRMIAASCEPRETYDVEQMKALQSEPSAPAPLVLRNEDRRWRPAA